MLTEGWDANTVTHILGVRAFGTQLLCEQVVGRALRRMSYAANESGHFDPEYAEVYGVPFSFIPCSGATTDPKPGPLPTRVRALESRIACEITFPRLLGYRYDVAGERLTATFTDESRLALSTADIPTKTENAPIVGESSIHTLDDLKRRRPNEVAFLLAKLTLEKYFRDDDGNDKPWLFPQLLGIAKRWLAECVTLKDNTFPQLLLLIEFAHDAADRIYKAIVASTDGTAALKPILRPYDTLGSTRYVDFDTTRPVFATRDDKCHISHVVADTDSWEQKMAEALEDMPEVVRYVKNHNLGFTIPYTLNGEEKHYIPDFIACIDDGHGPDDLLEPDRRSHRREEERQGRQGRHGAHAVGAGRQQPRRLRALGVPRSRRPVGRTTSHPWLSDNRRRSESTKEIVSWLKRPPPRRRSNPSATRTSAPTSPPRSCATSWPRMSTPPRPCSTRATRPSIRNWSGRARTSRTAQDLAVPVVPIYIQEKIHPQAIIDALPRIEQPGDDQPNLFADFNGGPDDFDQKIEFYHHEQNWTNRLILGDSLLVMTSLAEKEGLKGKVQTIYLDPPYGIKFGSNWQVSTRKRDVKDGKAEDATRQPEQVRAFRDTWKLGIHSYLAYLRDRLVVARDLLTETGSVFVQIGDENVHLVRCVLDEVFGSENFCAVMISVKTSVPIERTCLPACTTICSGTQRIEEHVKYRQLVSMSENLRDEGRLISHR